MKKKIIEIKIAFLQTHRNLLLDLFWFNIVCCTPRNQICYCINVVFKPGSQRGEANTLTTRLNRYAKPAQMAHPGKPASFPVI